MNPQSRGTVTLRSPDPSDAPLIDPRFLTHPYDQRVVIEGTRQTLRLLSAPVYAKDTVKTVGPENDSDEAILVRKQRSVDLVSKPLMVNRNTLVRLVVLPGIWPGQCAWARMVTPLVSIAISWSSVSRAFGLSIWQSAHLSLSELFHFDKSAV